MKIYISLPISGRDLGTCRGRAERAKVMVERRGHTAITPFDVCPEQGLAYAEYIGRDITALLGCDGIFLMTGWHNSCGCCIEYHAASIFRKQVYLCANAIPNITGNGDETY